MKYELVYAYCVGDLEEYVNNRLQDGWELYGSPFSTIESSEKCTSNSGNNTFFNEVQYVQAMVKHE